MKETGTGRWVAWAALSTMAVGCATVLGIDKDYHPVGGGEGGGGPWDGGRLPTEAEWNYATAGGSEQREYPWGSAAPDSNHAVYNVNSPVAVGSKAAGDGKWKQADLAGSMFEWNLDGYVTPYAEVMCDDCAHLQDNADRGARGGSWANSGLTFMLSADREHAAPAERSANFGARCARAP